MKKSEWLKQEVMCDEWGRPPSLADVPLTIMTRKDAPCFITSIATRKALGKAYKKLKDTNYWKKNRENA